MNDDINQTLIGCTDAQIWAKEFIKVVDDKPWIPEDEATMIGWFANAIMSGHDEGARLEQERDIVEKLHEIIFRAAGAASAVFMQAHPNDVMPSEEIIEAVNAVCKSFGIPQRV